MKKTINFINKTYKHIILAFDKLRKRYKTVEFIFSLRGVLCTGYFIVEGKGVKHLKYT